MRRRSRRSGKPHARSQRLLARGTPNTTLGGADYDYDQTYDDIGGIYDSCDDYNYDSNPADDI